MSSDIRHEHLILKKTPPRFHPYILLARLDRPIGIWLLLLPCLWGIILAMGPNIISFRFWELIGFFSLGAALMRSAGCIINDLWDKNLDGQVERTKTRPLASGAITPKQALKFLIGLLIPAFIILTTLNKTAIILGLLALPLVAVYPFMKRVTWWPQAFLGLTFNWGALMGWAAVHDSISAAPVLLYFSGFFWTLAYDTIYAHQDKDDDVLVGIKSTALLFGKKSKTYVFGFMAASLILATAAKYTGNGSILTPVIFLIVAFYAIRLVSHWEMNDPQSCLQTFQKSRTYGWLILLMLTL